MTLVARDFYALEKRLKRLVFGPFIYQVVIIQQFTSTEYFLFTREQTRIPYSGLVEVTVHNQKIQFTHLYNEFRL